VSGNYDGSVQISPGGPLVRSLISQFPGARCKVLGWGTLPTCASRKTASREWLLRCWDLHMGLFPTNAHLCSMRSCFDMIGGERGKIGDVTVPQYLLECELVWSYESTE
jgi:hypothetical protein